MGRTAIYAGSFDPITHGHLDIIERGAALFDRVVVALGDNPAKRYYLSVEERRALVEEVTEGLDSVEVVPFDGLLVHTAAELGADVILRGLRNSSDFDSEFQYGLANRDLSGIETLFLCSDPKNIFVSSSIVKEIARYGGDVSAYVPPAVLEAMKRRSP